LRVGDLALGTGEGSPLVLPQSNAERVQLVEFDVALNCTEGPLADVRHVQLESRRLGLRGEVFAHREAAESGP